MERTRKQREVVEWLVANGHDDEPQAAVRANLISGRTLYELWGREEVKAWCAEHRATLPPPPMSAEEVSARLQAMVPSACDTLAETIRRGKGDKIAVDLAKWIIEQAKPAGQSSVPSDPAEAELANVLRFGSR